MKIYNQPLSKAPKGYINGTYHVGVDTNNLTPISIEQIWRECWPQEIMTKEVQEYKDSHNITCETCQRECGPDNKCDGFARNG